MAIVITNGTYYLNYHNGKIRKTLNIEEATKYYHINKAMSNILKRPTQCKGYYLFDTDDKVGRILMLHLELDNLRLHNVTVSQLK